LNEDEHLLDEIEPATALPSLQKRGGNADPGIAPARAVLVAVFREHVRPAKLPILGPRRLSLLV